MKWTEIVELLLHLIDTITLIIGLAVTLEDRKPPKHKK